MSGLKFHFGVATLTPPASSTARAGLRIDIYGHFLGEPRLLFSQQLG